MKLKKIFVLLFIAACSGNRPHHSPDRTGEHYSSLKPNLQDTVVTKPPPKRLDPSVLDKGWSDDEKRQVEDALMRLSKKSDSRAPCKEQEDISECFDAERAVQLVHHFDQAMIRWNETWRAEHIRIDRTTPKNQEMSLVLACFSFMKMKRDALIVSVQKVGPSGVNRLVSIANELTRTLPACNRSDYFAFFRNAVSRGALLSSDAAYQTLAESEIQTLLRLRKWDDTLRDLSRIQDMAQTAEDGYMETFARAMRSTIAFNVTRTIPVETDIRSLQSAIEKSDHFPTRILFQHLLANLAHHAKDLDGSMKQFDQILAVLKAQKEAADYLPAGQLIQLHMDAGETYEEAGRFNEARVQYETAANWLRMYMPTQTSTIRKMLEDAVIAVTRYHEQERSNYGDAIRLFDKVWRLEEEGSFAYVSTGLDLVELLLSAGKTKRAQEVLKTLQDSISGLDANIYAGVLEHAQVLPIEMLVRNGDVTSAEQMINSHLDTRLINGKQTCRQTKSFLTYLVVRLLEAGAFDTAEKYADRIIEVCTQDESASEHKDRKKLIYFQHIMALRFMEMGRLDPAARYLQKAEKIAGRNTDGVAAIPSTLTLGVVRDLQGKDKAARSLIKKGAMRFSTSNVRPREQVIMYRFYSNIYAYFGKCDQSARFKKREIEICEETPTACSRPIRDLRNLKNNCPPQSK